MKLTVSQTAKGEVIFPTLGYPVKSGHTIYPSKEQFYANDIQTGIRNGLLSVEEEGPDNELKNKIEVLNISGKNIGVGDVSLLIDERKFISEEESKSQAIKNAEHQGLIEIIYPETKDEIDNEPEIEKKSRKKKKKSPKKKSTKKKSKKKTASTKSKEPASEDEEAIEKIKEESSQEAPHKMRSWDASTQKMLDKEESSNSVIDNHGSKVDSDENSEVQVGEVNFEEDSNQKPKRKAKISVSSKSKKNKSKSIKPVGKARSKNEQLPNEEDIVFVDQQQTQERLQQRGLAGQNEEIE